MLCHSAVLRCSSGRMFTCSCGVSGRTFGFIFSFVSSLSRGLPYAKPTIYEPSEVSTLCLLVSLFFAVIYSSDGAWRMRFGPSSSSSDLRFGRSRGDMLLQELNAEVSTEALIKGRSIQSEVS